MRNPDRMTNEQLMAWTDKTLQSIGSYMFQQSASAYTHRGRELVDRYTLLAEEMQSRENMWESFCLARNLHTEHTAFDCFA